MGGLCVQISQQLPTPQKNAAINCIMYYLNRIPCTHLYRRGGRAYSRVWRERWLLEERKMRPSSQREVGKEGGKYKWAPLSPLEVKKFSMFPENLNTALSGVSRTIQAETTHFTTRQVTASGSSRVGRWPGVPAVHQLPLLPAGFLLFFLSSLLFPLSVLKSKPEIQLAPQRWLETQWWSAL